MTTIDMVSISRAQEAADKEGLMKVCKAEPQESKTYGAVIAKYVVYSRASPWKGDFYWAHPEEIRYLGKLVKEWTQGSGDGRETIRQFTHGGKTVTMRSDYHLCWVEMDAPETQREKVPADALMI